MDYYGRAFRHNRLGQIDTDALLEDRICREICRNLFEKLDSKQSLENVQSIIKIDRYTRRFSSFECRVFVDFVEIRIINQLLFNKYDSLIVKFYENFEGVIHLLTQL